jgi:hypothetical protein
VAADEPPAQELIAAMVDELAELYRRIDRSRMPSATAGDFTPPGGVRLVGWLGEEPVHVGAVTRLGDGLGEIKRICLALARQPHASGLCLSAGHREIPGDDQNPAASFWGEQEL